MTPIQVDDAINEAVENVAYVSNLSSDSSLVLADAESLGGLPAENYATKNYVVDTINQAQLSGDNSEVDLSIYATKDDLTLVRNAIPTTPEAIGAEISGAANNALNNAKTYVNEQINAIDYPVDSINGKTGAVQLSAEDVGARPNTWMPTATEVGALSTNGGTVSGHINMVDQFTVYGLIDPLSPHDAMTKRYADANYAPTSHKHDNYYLKRYSLNAINIDDTDGSWEVDISDYDHGTVPANWVNVTQHTSGHFYSQIAKQCQSSNNATRKNSGLWYREKYVSGAWSAWSMIYHEGVKPTASEIGAAPAGYGLGAETARRVTIAELDTLTSNGWYLVNNDRTGLTLNNVPFNWAICRVLGANDQWNVKQELFPIGINNVRLVRAKESYTLWYPWECDNPIMTPSVEYRTTEWWNGKVVYTKAVNVGNLPNNSIKNIEGIVTDGCTEIFYAALRATYATLSILPWKDGIFGWVSLQSTSDLSGYTEVLTIKYTKD